MTSSSQKAMRFTFHQRQMYKHSTAGKHNRARTHIREKMSSSSTSACRALTRASHDLRVCITLLRTVSGSTAVSSTVSSAVSSAVSSTVSSAVSSAVQRLRRWTSDFLSALVDLQHPPPELCTENQRNARECTTLLELCLKLSHGSPIEPVICDLVATSCHLLISWPPSPDWLSRPAAALLHALHKWVVRVHEVYSAGTPVFPQHTLVVNWVDSVSWLLVNKLDDCHAHDWHGGITGAMSATLCRTALDVIGHDVRQWVEGGGPGATARSRFMSGSILAAVAYMLRTGQMRADPADELEVNKLLVVSAYANLYPCIDLATVAHQLEQLQLQLQLQLPCVSTQLPCPSSRVRTSDYLLMQAWIGCGHRQTAAYMADICATAIVRLYARMDTGDSIDTPLRRRLLRLCCAPKTLPTLALLKLVLLFNDTRKPILQQEFTPLLRIDRTVMQVEQMLRGATIAGVDRGPSFQLIQIACRVLAEAAPIRATTRETTLRLKRLISLAGTLQKAVRKLAADRGVEIGRANDLSQGFLSGIALSAVYLQRLTSTWTVDAAFTAADLDSPTHQLIALTCMCRQQLSRFCVAEVPAVLRFPEVPAFLQIPRHDMQLEWENFSSRFSGGLLPGCCNRMCTSFVELHESNRLSAKLCSGCRRVRYCCVRCQKQGWLEGEHKAVCRRS